MSRPDQDTRTCLRCGIKRRIRQGRPTPLCYDCRTIAADLGELELWTGAAA